MISVLLPTRGRHDSLARSVASLRDRAVTRLEILVAVDPDDQLSIDRAHELGATVWVAPQRYGYHGLHHYFNHLASMATGRWLLLWNDDATMLTDAWDVAVAEVAPPRLIADLQSQHTPNGFMAFPAVRARLARLVGGFSPHNSHCDSYWQQIGTVLDLIAPVDVHVHHDRCDVTGGHNDQTWADQRNGNHSGDFHSPAVQALIAADTEKIRANLPGLFGLLQPGQS